MHKQRIFHSIKTYGSSNKDEHAPVHADRNIRNFKNQASLSIRCTYLIFVSMYST